MAVASDQHNSPARRTIHNVCHPHIAGNLALNHGTNCWVRQHIAMALLNGFILSAKQLRRDLIEPVGVNHLWTQYRHEALGHDFAHINMGQVGRNEFDFFLKCPLHKWLVEAPLPSWCSRFVQNTVNVLASGKSNIQHGLIFTIKLLHRHNGLLPFFDQLQDTFKSEFVAMSVVMNLSQKQDFRNPLLDLTLNAL